jgi:hypothetical protein
VQSFMRRFPNSRIIGEGCVWQHFLTRARGHAGRPRVAGG